MIGHIKIIQVHIAYSMVGMPRKDVISSRNLINATMASFGEKYVDGHQTVRAKRIIIEIMVPAQFKYI